MSMKRLAKPAFEEVASTVSAAVPSVKSKAQSSVVGFVGTDRGKEMLAVWRVKKCLTTSLKHY